jgi:hypothetical protein
LAESEITIESSVEISAYLVMAVKFSTVVGFIVSTSSKFPAQTSVITHNKRALVKNKENFFIFLKTRHKKHPQSIYLKLIFQ